MTSTLVDAHSEMTSFGLPLENLSSHSTQPLTKDELDGVLRALDVPFAVNLVQWRVTEWCEDGTSGLMMPYADPYAYSDRLNSLFTAAGWTRKCNVQASAPVQLDRRRRSW